MAVIQLLKHMMRSLLSIHTDCPCAGRDDDLAPAFLILFIHAGHADCLLIAGEERDIAGGTAGETISARHPCVLVVAIFELKGGRMDPAMMRLAGAGNRVLLRGEPVQERTHRSLIHGTATQPYGEINGFITTRALRHASRASGESDHSAMRPILLLFLLATSAYSGYCKYSIDLSRVCDTMTEIAADKPVRVELDGHIIGPLVGEIEQFLAAGNPGLEFIIRSSYRDCNTCGTLMACDAYWHTTLYIRGAVTRITCSPFVRDWTMAEVRERWRPSLYDLAFNKDESWPFEPRIKVEGDMPPVF